MAADGGVLRLELELAEGVVRAATIRSTRPKRLGRLFHGRRADEAAALARLLFTLCGRAHAAAAALAAATAQCRPLGDETLRREAVGVLAERVFETLRASVMGWPSAEPQTAAALREAVVAAQALAKEGGQDALAALRRAAAALGFGEDEPAADTALGQPITQARKVSSTRSASTPTASRRSVSSPSGRPSAVAAARAAAAACARPQSVNRTRASAAASSARRP